MRLIVSIFQQWACVELLFKDLEAVVRRCSVKKVFLEILQNSQENTSARDSFLINNFIKKETLVQAFFCEFCEISKNTYSYRTPLVAINCNYWWVLLMLRKKIILLCWYIAINCYYNLCLNFFVSRSYTAQKLRFSIKDFLRISSHLLKKFLMENFIFCAVLLMEESQPLRFCKIVPIKKKFTWLRRNMDQKLDLTKFNLLCSAILKLFFKKLRHGDNLQSV